MLKGLGAIRELAGVKRSLLVYGGGDSWTADHGVEVMSPARFVDAVARGL